MQPQAIPRRAEYCILACVALNVACIIASTTPWGQAHTAVFNALDALFIGLFAAEYVWRLAHAPAVAPRFSGLRGRLKYALTPMALVDLLAILPAVFFWSDATVLRTLRLLAVFRVFKLLRYQNAARRLMRAVQTQAPELAVVLVTLCVFIVIAAVAMYGAEHQAQPKVFASVLDGLWWAIITATTIGYGDIVPVTPAGKIIASACAFIGILLIALPTSLVAAAFMSQSTSPSPTNATNTTKDTP